MSAASPMQPGPFSGRVSNEWFDRGAWLSQAAETFADDYQIAQFRQHVERFAGFRDGETPEMFEWSSNLSGKARDKELLNRLIHDEEKNAFRLYLASKDILQMTLKNKLYSGSLVAFGARGAPDADLIWIPTRAWFYLRLHLDEGSVVRGEGTAYWHVRVIDSRDAIAAFQAQPPEVQRSEVKSIFQSEVEGAFFAWMGSMEREPTIRQCGEWARDNGFGVERGRKLYSAHIRRGRGRPPKNSTT